MNAHTLEINFSKESAGYEIQVGHGLLGKCGKWARRVLGSGTGRVVLISNPTVFKLYGEAVHDSFVTAGFGVEIFLMKDGERYKSLKTAESALKFISELRLSRTDAVVALGGGVVGDMAGFASAIYLRGIDFLQIPTTLLSMIDSSVGGKTGVNSAFGKNLIGSFHQPKGVLVDIDTLRTLPTREITAGFCEAIKQGAIGGRKLLNQMGKFLVQYSLQDFPVNSNTVEFQTALSELIASQIGFKASVVAGDERESQTRRDSKSRKILNFGHTLAHALEKVTDYKYFKHGEAVGYGILFAAELSKSLALCDEKDVKLLNDVVQAAGTLPRLKNIDEVEVFEAFKFDKKHLSGSLQMILLKGIGRPVILTDREIPQKSFQRVLNKFLQEWS